ncbi:Ig-like domain-containing protein [Anaerosporobacter sp.]
MKRRIGILVLSSMLMVQQVSASSLVYASYDNSSRTNVEGQDKIVGSMINVDDQVTTTWTSGNTTVTLEGDVLKVTAIKGTDGSMEDDKNDWVSSHIGKIRSIVVEKGVTSIGRNAFKGLIYTEFASIAGTVTSIGDGAFADCKNMDSILIQESVTTFGTGVFEGSNLVNVRVYYGSAAHIAISKENVMYSFVDFKLPYVFTDYKFDHTTETEFPASISYGTASTLRGIEINGVALPEDKYIVTGKDVAIQSSAFDGLSNKVEIKFCFVLDDGKHVMESYFITDIRLTTAGTPVILETIEHTFFDEAQSDVIIPVEMNGAELEEVKLGDVVVEEEKYSTKKDAVVLTNSYVKSLDYGYNDFMLYFNDGTECEVLLFREESIDNSEVPAVLNYYSELDSNDVIMKYTLGLRDTAATAVTGILVDGKEYTNITRTTGPIYTVDEQNKTITINAAFIESLALDDGYHVFGATFNDTAKTSSKTVLVLKEENTSVDGPGTGDNDTTPTPPADGDNSSDGNDGITPTPPTTDIPTTPPVTETPSAPVIPPVVETPIVPVTPPVVETPIVPVTPPTEEVPEEEEKEESKLTLSKTSATLYTKGLKTIKLTAKVSGESKKVTYTSSNSKVATVSQSGTVTAKSVGTATITAETNGIKATCKIVVKKPTLKVNQSKLSVRVGKSKRITASIKPVGNIKFTSSNKKVATVTKNGTVKGKKAGTAKITVECHGIKKTVKVTVKKASSKK